MESTAPLDGELYKLLECPVCFKPMTSPIEQCCNGHSICKDCRENLNECHTCKVKYTGIRNRMGEQFAERISFPCENADAGCSAAVLGSQLEFHGRVCPHRIYKCLLCSCEWSGRATEILGHFNDTHKIYVAEQRETSSDIISKFDEEEFFSKLIQNHGEIFWCTIKTDPVRHIVSIVVQFIGPQEKASNFYCKFKFVSSDKNYDIAFTGKVHSDVQDARSIMECRECIEFGTGMLQWFVDEENKLPCERKILKRNDP